jgi:ligand-binding sensor domain-containing protein
MKRFLWLLSGCLMLALLLRDVTVPAPGRAQGGNGSWTNHTLEYWTHAFAVQGNTLWVGTNGGLLRWNLTDDTTRKFTPADGLVGTVIHDLALDTSGDIWVGHDRGLSVYDGSTWTTYDQDNSGVPSDEVIQLEVASDGTVWLISQPIASDIGLGVTVYDGGTWYTYTEDNSDLPDDNAVSLGLDGDDHLWVCARDGDVAQFDGSGWTVYPDPTYNHNALAFAGEDNLGQIWFTSFYNVAPVLMFDGTWHAITPGNGCDNGVRRGAIDGSGKLWLTTWAGLCRYDGATWSRYHEGNSDILDDLLEAVVAQGQKVWVGYGFGPAVPPVSVTQFDGASWTQYHKPQILPSGFGLGLAADQQGRKWFGLGNKGVASWDGETWMVYDDSNSGLPATCTTRITEDLAGHLWFAGGGCTGGLVEFDGLEDWTQHQGPGGVPDTTVRAVAVDQGNRIWAGSEAGLSVYNGVAWTTYNSTNSGLPSDNVDAVAVDGQGHIWAGCTTRFDGVTWETHASPEAAIEAYFDDIVETFHQDYRCWVADEGRQKVWRTNSNLGVKAYDGLSWQTYGWTTMDLTHPYTWIARPRGLDGTGNLWVIASDSHPRYGGVSRFDGTTWTGYRQADGLLEPPKFEIATDPDNHVWFTTGFGASEFFDPWQPTQTLVTPGSGGKLTSADGSTTVEFPAGAVAQDTLVTLTPMQPSASAPLVGIGHFFDLSAAAARAMAPAVDFAKPYTLTVHYTDEDRATAIEDTLGLYWWDGGQWLPEGTSSVDPGTNRVTATPDHMTLFAVLGETNRVYLPLVMRAQ